MRHSRHVPALDRPTASRGQHRWALRVVPGGHRTDAATSCGPDARGVAEITGAVSAIAHASTSTTFPITMRRSHRVFVGDR
ncbi:hypothetical protein [Lentzea sp. NPDC059081]|uniref:hypothetical protein n=1 Tax=Lentzea sp. NPDC059081 TaxID=3346719 RepID=UPI0036C5714F